MTKQKHSKSEVGHLKNVASLKLLLTKIENLEAYYPVNPLIYIVDLRKVYNDCDLLVRDAIKKRSDYNHIVNQRQEAYLALSPLATRVKNAVDVITNGNQKTMDDLDNFIDKLRGVPAVPETKEDEIGQEIKEVRSNAQLSFDNLAGHFSGMIDFVEGIKGGYLPNEEDLQLPALKVVLADLINLNHQVNTAETHMENAAIARNRALYGAEEGLYDRTQTVKKYVLSVYGHNSSEFEQVEKIKFKDQVIKK